MKNDFAITLIVAVLLTLGVVFLLQGCQAFMGGCEFKSSARCEVGK
jgi:hypothetical protein